jgi:hypothetical protein
MRCISHVGLLKATFIVISSLFFLHESQAQSMRTATFTGAVSDFNAAEGIASASNNTSYYITFDANNLYLGAFRTVGNFGSTDNFTVYLDTDPNSAPTSGIGTTAGQSYNGVTGTLPFTANYNIHAEQSFQEARDFAGTWANTISGVTYNTGSTWREVAIPFSSIGNPDALYLTMWMGFAGGIYSNAPGADLGSGANPTVVNYIGGFGVSSADCIPVNTTNTPITSVITDAVPAAGITYGKVNITSASITASNNFNIAPGGSIQVSGGTLDISGRTINMGGAVGTGRGTTINYSGGTLVSSSGTNITFGGEGAITGSNLTYEGILTINRKFTPLAAGGTTLGTAAMLDIRTTGFVNANALTYAAGSTLCYNTGSTFTASTEWNTGATAGVGVPSNVTIGNAVANSVVSFGTSGAYRHARANVTISNTTTGSGLTLSSSGGGDLSLAGDFVQNGTFTHNNRSVAFIGTTAQSISGTLNTPGSTNNFPYLIVNNTGAGVTINTDVLVSQTSGDVLQLINSGPLNIGATRTLTVAGNGGNIRVTGASRTINFNAASSIMNITGTKTVTTTGGSLSFTSSAANGNLRISAGVNFGAGLTTIGNNTFLQIEPGGSVTTNPPTYATGSTLVYNTASFNASTEWTVNATTGAGVPHNVLIGNGTNTTFGFAAAAQFRQANGNVTISSSSSLALSSAAGGDLQLRGDFSQNGTFTHNNRSVTFNGTGSQAISGTLNTAGATNNFPYLIINNAGSGVTLNANVLVSQTSGDVLQLINSGPLNIGATRTLTVAGNGGNIRVTGASRTINFNAATSIMSITGTKTVVTAGGSLSFTSSAANGNLRISAGVNFGASLTTIGNNTYFQIETGGSVTTNAPIYATGSTLVYNTAAFNASTEWTPNVTTGAGVPHHVLIGNGTNTAFSFAASNQFRHANGNVTISPSSSMTLSSAGGGNLQLSGNFANNGTFTNNGRDVTFNGTAAQQQLSGATTFQNMILNNSFGLLLNNAISVSNVLTLTSGSITLGSNNITLTSTATGAIAGTFSATRMIVTNGTGQLIRAITTGTNYTFPVGETTGTTEYSPALFNFSANSVARNIGVRVVDADHPQVNTSPAQTDYISRYWLTSNSAAGTYTYTTGFTFVAADLNGSESNLRANMWNSASWNQVLTSSSASNVLSITSGATNATVPLGATAEFTGRVNNGSTYTWNVGNASWAASGSWTPARITPAVNDILIFNNANVTASNVPTETIGQLLINGTSNVILTPVSANRVLTIAGGNGTDFNIASTATLTLNNGNATTIAFANSTVATIAGVLNLSGSTNNELDCTNSAVTVSGSINSFGTVTSTSSNLSFSSTGIYRHNYTTSAGTIPSATWNATSTCLIQGYTTGGGGGGGFTPGGLSQSFGHFTWNCASQSNDAQLNATLTSIAGNFTITSANGRDIRLSDASSMTLNIGGNLSLANNGTELRFSQGGGTYTVQVNVAGNYSQTNTSTLNLTNGNSASAGVLRVAGNFSFSAGTITQTSAGTNAGNLIEFNGSANQAVNIGGTFSNEINFRLNNTAGMTLTGTIPIISSCTFYRTAGAITGGTINYSATGTTLVYEGTTAMTTGVEFPSSNGPEDVTVNSTNTISLSGPRSLPVGGVFTNTSGVFSLGSNDLTLLNSATGALVNASPSASNMIAAGGSGQLRRTIATGGNTYLFPIGDITGAAEYSGVSMNFTANNTTRVLGFRVVDGFNANDSTALLPSIDYTSRTWYTTLSVTTGTYTYTPTFSYSQAGDVYGTENNMLVSNWTGASWSSRPSLVSSGSPTSTIVTTGTVTQATLSLNGAEIMGRAPIKYWTGNTSNAWATGSNWVPAGAPISSDNIDISFYTNFPCVLSSGSATINHLTLSGTGDFTLNSGATLIVAGNFTYDNPASAVFSCGSTLTLNNGVYPQTVPAISYGNLNIAGGTRVLSAIDTISICNDYTPTNGTLTNTGSTVEFNGTSAQSILVNATGFNNLTISNTSASVSSAFNVGVSGAMVVNANARYNQSANTLTINSGATATINGFLRNAATVTPTGTLTVASGGTYEHNTTTPGTIPVATWNTGSTCELIGNFSDGNLNCGSQAYHHFKVNYTGNGDVNLNETLTTVNGDLTIESTGTGTFSCANSGAVTINVGGNVIQNAGDWIVSSGNNTDVIINVIGNFSQTNGRIDMFSGNGSATCEFRLEGDYSRTGSSEIETTGLVLPNGLFTFTGTTQSITETSSGSNRWVDYVITSGSTTSLLSNLNIWGSASYVANFVVSSGGVLDLDTYVIGGTGFNLTNITSGSKVITANTEGLTSSTPTGSIRTATRTYNSGATYEFDGTANQNTGNFWTTTSTANSVANLIVNNTATTLTLNSGTNVTISGTLTFASTNTAAFNVGAQTVYVSNTATAAVNRVGLGHVIGILRRAYTTGANNYVFDVGTSTGYSPASFNLNASAAGSFTVRATDGPHPNMATNGMSQTAYVNRYWSVAYVFGNLTSNTSTFTYIPADLIGGATTPTLRLKRFSAGWTSPTYTSTVNQLSASGLTNTTTYGDFFAAADCAAYVASITPASSTTFCNGGSVDLTASSNITGSTFSWSPATGLSATTGATVTATPTTTTTYTVTATSPQNCVDTETVTVTVNARPTASVSGSTTICNGSSSTVAITVTGSGTISGTLNPGAIAFSGTAPTINVSVSPSSTTTYSVASLSDANCTSIAGDLTGTRVVNVNARPTASVSGSTTICNGGSTSIAISVTGSGTISGTLNPGAIAFSGTAPTINVSVSPSSTTTYSVASLSDANCTSIAGDLTGTRVVNVNSRPTGVVSGTQTICNGSAATLSIAVTGSGPWSGTLSSGDSFSGSSSPITVSVTPLSNTTYTIATLNDANCSANAGDLSGSATVSLNTRPTGNLGGNQTVCVGGTATIYMNTTGSGTYSGTLNPGGIPFSGSGAFITIDVTPAATTTYTIATLSDANCSALPVDLTGSPVVTVHPLPSASISGSTVVCAGVSANITFTGTPDAEVTYNVNGGSNQTVMLDGLGNATVNTGVVNTTLTYTLVGVDDFVCQNSASGSVVITKSDLPEADITGSASICSGSSVTIFFTGTPSATLTYNVNAGPNQTIVLNGSGNASFNTGALVASTTYTLVSVSNGSCSQPIGSSVLVSVNTNTYYQDSDNDGFGNALVTTTGCTPPVGYVSNDDDCCDTNADLNPLTEWWADVDGDGYGGFVIDNGCLFGVTCNPLSWPTNFIPYYPAAHGGAPYVIDCADSQPTVYPGAIELCGNNTDDDCDGSIDEGCAVIPNDAWVNATSMNTSIPAAIYPNCFNYNGVVLNAGISPQGNSANVAPGGGRDVWYKFVAPSTAIQIKLAPNGFDGVIELQNSSAVQIDVENANNTIGGLEVLNIGSLTAGQTYYVGVRNFHATNVGTFSICASPMMPSGCGLVEPVGGFALCTNYKALYRGANTYTFNFTGTGGTAPLVTTSATSTGLMPLTTPALDIRYGGEYNVKVDAHFVVYNGVNALEPTITVSGNVASANCTGVSIMNQPLVEVRASQRCPSTLNRNTYLHAVPVPGNGLVCGAVSYSYEFTRVTDCTGATTLPQTFTVTTANSSPFLILAAAFPSAQANIGYWNVRVRPNFSWGSGAFGPVQTIQISGTAASMMLSENESEQAERSDETESQSLLYPNPNNGDRFMLNLVGANEEPIVVNIYDSFGRIVHAEQFSAEGSTQREIIPNNSLSSGFYAIEIWMNGVKLAERMIVTDK